MEEEKIHTVTEKWIIAIILGFVFLIISSHYIYNASNGIGSFVGIKTVTNGSPNKIGYMLHLLAFILIVRLLLK
tara:strand:- start:675 stop:896 length:222 start_codon:yes stop_codon:yes gene_type:complete